MSEREKLIELLEKGYSFSEEECHKHQSDCECCLWYDGSHLCGYVAIADYLIKNGVTMQRWIPVSESLPDKKVCVLVHYIHSYCDTDGYWAIGTTFFDGDQFLIGVEYKVTHWIQLPQPPKGE
jgi:hypothetical protein